MGVPKLSEKESAKSRLAIFIASVVCLASGICIALFYLDIIDFSGGSSAGVQPVSSELAAGCQKGNYVKFGRYPQNNDEFAPIEWLILDNDSNTALLISKYVLDCRRFHYLWFDSWFFEYFNLPWRYCNLRRWLNGHFLRKAFSSEDRQHIVNSNIYTGASRFGVRGCGETRDKVFCLSIEEAEEYFPDDKSRISPPTVYAESRGLGTHKWSTGGSIYWLRSPGDKGAKAVAVYGDGVIRRRGYYGCTGNSRWPMGNGAFGVRPALRIKL